MKKAAIVVAISLALAGAAFAVDAGQYQNGPGPDFDQRKTEILKMLDERASRIQEEKDCVQAAKNHEDLKVCREKQREKMEKMRQEMKEKRDRGGHDDHK